MSGAGLSPTLATYETSKVLLAGVPGGFSRGSPAFAQLLIGSYHMSWNNLDWDVKLKKSGWPDARFICSHKLINTIMDSFQGH